MKFGIITHAVHKIKNDHIYAYEPYVREMNLWGKYVDEIIIISPVDESNITNIETKYNNHKIKIIRIPNFDITSIKNLFSTLLVSPKICWEIYKVMKQVDHIHLRCPGNVGLLGCIVQVLFPLKPKTAKYAGNWDPKSKQPLSYRIQKWILSNTFLTKNIKVLVYGEWPNQTKNILPFFTASYNKNEIKKVEIKNFSSIINFIYVGAFSKGKQPLLSVKVTETLFLKGYNVKLDMFGEGNEFLEVKNYVEQKNLSNFIILHGNKSKEIVKNIFKQSHFLLFISQSEGWPKVVAEAMFWRCLPISSNVSCVKYMLGNSKRGSILNPDVSVNEVVNEVLNYLNNEDLYQRKALDAQKWSQNFTLNKFEDDIKKILN